jgi:hypothetical protein
VYEQVEWLVTEFTSILVSCAINSLDSSKSIYIITIRSLYDN